MDIEDAAAEVYGAPLGDFTARRTALAAEAKSAGDKELARAIAGLRRPTTAAWVVNMLARHRAERVAEIVELGAQLRDAQDALDAPRLRELGRQRSALIREVTREAIALAEELGTAASATLSEEVAQSLQTAMTDPDAAALVASGTLVRPITAAGWGLDEGGDVIAFPTAAQRAGRRAESKPPKQAPKKQGKRQDAARASQEAAREATEREFAEAEEALAAAREEAERLRADAETLAERRAALRDEVQELTRQLREAEGELADVEGEARGIRRSRDDAKRALTAAERAVARARTRVERTSRD
ncbi:transposase [Salinibacterium sp. SYSU T00001]|uniref:transposase n=1 Tax=Homoserinimonas sedimenticola TaxID=2986805 RepID=UPI0022367017|nr:transposase [Salinibacterium sedimenticola]MCW4385709.1 transposase [Salinibacterium sedimenticola]